tara:strand:- start:364 stop:606 length:243 start_codon:yes stop_codon:yes gene_type:complete
LDTFHTPSPNNESREVIFKSNLSYLLNELRKTAAKIPDSKPIAVHCAGGYRSAAGSSILESVLGGVTIFDLSDDVGQFRG